MQKLGNIPFIILGIWSTIFSFLILIIVFIFINIKCLSASFGRKNIFIRKRGLYERRSES